MPTSTSRGLAANKIHDWASCSAVDFLNALGSHHRCCDNEKVDLVIFAGDAYKDRSPNPTYQREWGRQVMRLSSAGIRTLLLTGNHDISPSVARAHTLQEFGTLQVPGVYRRG